MAIERSRPGQYDWRGKSIYDQTAPLADDSTPAVPLDQTESDALDVAKRPLHYELCELLASFTPQALSDLLKLLVARKHEGRSVLEVLDSKELQPTCDLLYEHKIISHYYRNYYLIPCDERGRKDPRRVTEDEYMSPIPEYITLVGDVVEVYGGLSDQMDRKGKERPQRTGSENYYVLPQRFDSKSGHYDDYKRSTQHDRNNPYNESRNPSGPPRDPPQRALEEPMYAKSKRQVTTHQDDYVTRRGNDYVDIGGAERRRRDTPKRYVSDPGRKGSLYGDDYEKPRTRGGSDSDNYGRYVWKNEGSYQTPRTGRSNEYGGRTDRYVYADKSDYSEFSRSGATYSKFDEGAYFPRNSQKNVYSRGPIENPYERVSKPPAPDEAAIAMTYFLLRKEEMSGLQSPTSGWYVKPMQQDQSLPALVALVIFMATNVNEILDRGKGDINNSISLLTDALAQICALLDEAYPTTKKLVYQLGWSKNAAVSMDSERLSQQLSLLHGVAVAESKLRSVSDDHDYDTLLQMNDEEIYDEIMEDIYDEIADKDMGTSGNQLGEEKKHKDNKLTQVGEVNMGLIERGITLSTIVQQSEENISQEAENEVNIVTKSINKAKEVVLKIVDVIHKEIEKIKQKIAEKKRKKAEAKEEKEKKAAAQKRQPEVPEQEEEKDEDDDEHIYEELIKLEKLEAKEAQQNEVYLKLEAVDDMLNEVARKTERGFYELLVERNEDMLTSSLALKADKNALIQEQVITSKEWNTIKRNKPVQMAQGFIAILMKKGDYGCRRFLEFLRKHPPMRDLYDRLMKAEDDWRNASLASLLSDPNTVNWDLVLSSVDLEMVSDILCRTAIITKEEDRQVRSIRNKEEKERELRKLLESKSPGDWATFMQAVEYQENTTKKMFETWDELDVLGNWKVLIDNLDPSFVAHTLFSRFIISSRQYSDVSSRVTEGEKVMVLENILLDKGKDEWQIFISSLKNKGKGHMMDTLLDKQNKRLLGEESDEGPQVAGSFMTYQLRNTIQAKDSVDCIAYDHETKLIYIGGPKQIKVYDLEGKRVDTIKSLPNGSRFSVDTNRKRILYAQKGNVRSIDLEGRDQNLSPLIAFADVGINSDIMEICYDVINDLYLITFKNTAGITVFNPYRKYVVRTIGKETPTCPIRIVCGASHLILAYHQDHIIAYNIRGEIQGRYPLKGPERVEVKTLASLTVDHLKRILICDSGCRRVVRVLMDGQWEYTGELVKKPTAIQVGRDGSLALGFADGSVNVYGDKRC